MRTLSGTKGTNNCSISKDYAGRITVVKEVCETISGINSIIRTTLTLSPNGELKLDKIAKSNGKAFSPVHKQGMNPSLYELFSTTEEALHQRNEMCSLDGILEEQSTSELMLAMAKIRFSGNELWQKTSATIAR